VRNSDRLVTPSVVIAGLLVAGVCVLATIGTVGYLVARGFDPKPVVTLASAVGAAAGTLINLMVTLAGRAGVAKVERNTGVLANGVYELADRMPSPLPRHAAEDTVLMGAAPAPPRE
jgi:hypothetical protein